MFEPACTFSGGAVRKGANFFVLISIVLSIIGVHVAKAPPAHAAQVRLWVKYAPLVYFHPEERYFPSSVENFFYGSKLSFARNNRIDPTIDVSPEADRLGVSSSAYTRREDGTTYKSTQCTRPRGGCSPRASGLRTDEGFYLDLDDPEPGDGNPRNYQEGYSSGTYASAPIYFQLRKLENSGYALTYWFFYPYNRKAPVNHEGDWEHISIRLNDDYEPQSIRYFQHDACGGNIEWSDAPKYRSTHPVVYSARGGHASYPAPGSHDICTVDGGGPFDQDYASGDGARWFTWATGVNVAKEDWYGFGGAWGEVASGPLQKERTGPLGPSPYKDPSPWKEADSNLREGAPDPEMLVEDDSTAGDTDGDGVTDGHDICPDVPGPASNQGCPQDTAAPVLAKPVASLSNPYSRTANYSIEATDDVGVTQMRVKATGDTDWRPWVDYVPQGTVILPDRYGEFTIWFQVRDAAGKMSSQRAADNVTRLQDTTAPTLGKPIATRSDGNSAYVSFSLDASDNAGAVPKMRVRLGPVEAEWRPWQDFVANGTVVLPSYGDYMIWFQVMDQYGNVSSERATDLIRRTAAVGLNLQQVDNNGNVRSCGSTETSPCSDIVRRFRTTISGDLLPKTDLLVKLWRYVNGTWTETSQSPFARYPITSSTVNFEFPSGAVAGLWRVQVQVPRDDAHYTDFAASGFQYIQKS